MLTVTPPNVDERARAGSHWLSVSELARQRGVRKQAISQAIFRWAAAGTMVSTRKAGRELLVNVAEYDSAKGEVGDLARELGETTKKVAEVSADPTYTEQQRRRAGYEADLKYLDLQKQLGRLLEVDDVQAAAITLGEALVRIVDQIVPRADEIASAVAKDGVLGVRAILKTMTREMRTSMADEMAKLLSLAMKTAAPLPNHEKADA